MRNYLNLLLFILLTGIAVNSPISAFADKGKNKTAAKQSFTVTGDINGMPVHMVRIELLRANDSITAIDSQTSDAAGHFVFSGTHAEPGLYRIRFQQDRFMLLSIDKGNTKVTAEWPVNDYVVQGSGLSIQLKTFVDTVRVFMMQMNIRNAQLDSVKETGNAVLIADATKNQNEANSAFTKFVKHYSDTTRFEPNAVLASRMIGIRGEMEYFETFSAGLQSRFPGTTMTRDYQEFMAKLKESMPFPTEIGDKAPDIKLEDMNGKLVSLSSFKGKYVLLDFWASWCGPCRGENPNVLAAYKKYSSKNFTVFGVSLDNNKEKWIQAVKKDDLPWQHVSDLKGWQSGAAAKYSVHSIPANFLVDPKGIIVAKNLRGTELDKKLEEILK